MQYLFAQWSKLSHKLHSKKVCIFLDYDGTLTPITKTPQQALLSKETKRILKNLAQNPRCILVIISGRSLSNIKKMVGIKNIIYVGNHGLEFGDLHTAFRFPISSRYKIILKQIKNNLINELATIKGVLIEDKKLSLCLHYRSVNKKNISIIKAVFNRVVAIYKVQQELRVLVGKEVLEISPTIVWDKGKIVSLILVLLRVIFRYDRIIPLYIGDDVTDENAFSILKNRGITIFVGKPKQTRAKYYLKNTQEVKELLKKISMVTGLA